MDDFCAALFFVFIIVVAGFAGAGINGLSIAEECKNFGYMTVSTTRYECKVSELPK